MTNLLLSAMKLSEVLGLSGFGFGIVLAVLAFLAIFVLCLSSFFKKNKSKQTEATAKESVTPTVSEEPVATETKVQEPVYTGYVTLEGLSEQDAATIMAITSHKTGIPVERLGFCSIRLKSPELINVSEQDAAAVMAITAHKTGIPLENLYFKSIRLMED